MAEVGSGITTSTFCDGGIASIEPHVPAQVVEKGRTVTHARGSIHDEPISAKARLPNRLRGFQVQVQVMRPELLPDGVSRIATDVEALNHVVGGAGCGLLPPPVKAAMSCRIA